MADTLTVDDVRARMAARAQMDTASLPVVRNQNPEAVQAVLDALPEDSVIKRLHAYIAVHGELPSYRPPPPPAPPAADPPTSDLSETAQDALGHAKSARIGIETLNFGVSLQQGALKMLNDEKMKAQVRQAYGDEGLALYVEAHKRLMQRGLEMASSAAQNLGGEFKITGQLLSTEASGVQRTGEYQLSASGPDWSVLVNHLGQAQVTAAGVDLSPLLATSSSSGFRWSSAAPGPGAFVQAKA